MLKFEEVNSVVKDNEVSINGHVIGKVTDEEAKYIISLIQGKATPTKPVATAPAQKTYKDVKTAYKIQKVDKLYRIYDDTYSKCYAHRIANAHIKALPNVITAEVPNSKGGTYKIWGFKTKAAAEKALATLPEKITAKEQELMAAKSKRD